MPIAYVRDDALKRLTITVVGDVTPAELLNLVEYQAAYGAWRYGVLYAADELTSPSSDDVHKMVREVDRLTAQHGRRGPVAIVSCQD